MKTASVQKLYTSYQQKADRAFNAFQETGILGERHTTPEQKIKSLRSLFNMRED